MEDLSSPAPTVPRRFTWPTVLSLLTALIAIGAVGLHLVGDIRHRVYLDYWQVDAGLFPKPADWLLINGYYGLIDLALQLLLQILSNFVWYLLFSIPLGLYVYALLSPFGIGRGKLPQWMQRLSERWRRLLSYILKSALLLSVFPVALFLAIFLAAVPSQLGTTAGKAAAEREIEDYRKGCEKSKSICVVLQKDGKIVAKGFIVDSSSSHIAIYDTELHRGRTLPREGLDTIGLRAPK